MNLLEFIQRWQRSTRTERSGAQEHFLDLCALVGHQTPAQLDPNGDFFTFEKGLAKSSGKQG